jgi:hypothetical protein
MSIILCIFWMYSLLTTFGEIDCLITKAYFVSQFIYLFEVFYDGWRATLVFPIF